MLTKYRTRESSRNSCSFKERSPTRSITLFFLTTSTFLVRWRLRLLNFSLVWFIPTIQDFITISSLQNWHPFLNSSLHCIKTRPGIFFIKKKKFLTFFFLIFFVSYKIYNFKKSMKFDRWGVTHGRWHVTHDTWCRVNSLSTVQLSSSNGLEVMMFWRSGGKGWQTQSINEWVCDQGVCRTHPGHI